MPSVSGVAVTFSLLALAVKVSIATEQALSEYKVMVSATVSGANSMVGVVSKPGLEAGLISVIELIHR